MELTKKTKQAIEASEFYDEEMFESDCKTFIKALKAGRVILSDKRQLHSSTDIYIQSYEGTMARGWFRQYVRMLECLGLTVLDNRTIRVSGYPYDVHRNIILIITKLLKKNGIITEKKVQDSIKNFNY